MESKHTVPMTPFDNLISTSQLQMMKVMLPYLPFHNQKFFAVYIKFMELSHTMQYFRGFRGAFKNQSLGHAPDFSGLIEDIRPYMNEADAAQMEQMMNMLHMMEMMKDMGGTDTGFGDPFSMMMQMMPPEQQEMFTNYNEMFRDLGTPSQTQEGDEKDGRNVDEPPAAEKYGPAKEGADQNSR